MSMRIAWACRVIAVLTPALAACGSDHVTGGTAAPRCGDLACNGQETCASCPGDCGTCNVPYCGNGACDGTEFCGTCAQDCGACPGSACGNGTCASAETCRNCPDDCDACAPAACGDGECTATTESCASCTADCGTCPVLCGTTVCEVGQVCTSGQCAARCVSACDGKACGDDGCGGSCGNCADGASCVAGTCEIACTADCGDKVCGDDGCGGSCGTCASGSCVAGACTTTCTPSCNGKVCGDDGCGGSCGTCASGSCVAGYCQAAGPCGGVPAVGCCTADHAVQRCVDGAVVREDCASAGAACTWGDDDAFGCDIFLQSTPAGTATACPGEACTDTCAGKNCGTACGVSCGTCAGGEFCAGNHCVDDPCLGLEIRGCCFGNAVVFCDTGDLNVISCPADLPCGWDVTSPDDGYVCGGTGVDPSGEVSYFCPFLPAKAPTLPTAGDLVISEFMPNPEAASDANGEWFEVYNRAHRVLALEGLVVEGAASEMFTVDTTVFVQPGQYAIFAQTDAATNGGVQADVVFGGSFSLTNTADSITLRAGGVVVDAVTYGAGWPIASGVALSLRAAGVASGDNDAASAWCAAPTVSANGDKGTPRGPNDCKP